MLQPRQAVLEGLEFPRSRGICPSGEFQGAGPALPYAGGNPLHVLLQASRAGILAVPVLVDGPYLLLDTETVPGSEPSRTPNLLRTPAHERPPFSGAVGTGRCLHMISLYICSAEREHVSVEELGLHFTVGSRVQHIEEIYLKSGGYLNETYPLPRFCPLLL